MAGVVALAPGGARVSRMLRAAMARSGSEASTGLMLQEGAGAVTGDAASSVARTDAGAATGRRSASDATRSGETPAALAVHAAPERGDDGGLAPVVAVGATTLRDGVVATRAGDTVTVRFDIPGWRTRRADRFERAVRTTLPQVYGSAADALLASTQPYAIATPASLLTELPARGARLELDQSHSLVLWPVTRPASGGPLVVGYRARVVR